MSATITTVSKQAETTAARRRLRAPEPAGRQQSSTPAACRSDDRFDLAAWVHGIVARREETPAQPMKRPIAPRDAEPTAQPAPPARVVRLDGFDLAAWVFGVARRVEETPPTPIRTTGLRRERRPVAPPALKALTLPDLFDEPALPRCLQDD